MDPIAGANQAASFFGSRAPAPSQGGGGGGDNGPHLNPEQFKKFLPGEAGGEAAGAGEAAAGGGELAALALAPMAVGIPL